MRFLFPSDYLNPKKVDTAYLEQFNCMKNAGFAVSIISLESLGSRSSKIIPVPDPDSTVVYRGWMLSPSDYELLVGIVESTGARVLTCKAEYLATHYLPNWYASIADLTPETKFYSVDDDLESELNELGWSRFFIKDYVKSLKTLVGSIIDRPSEIGEVVTQMKKFRGSIEGGICVRRNISFNISQEQIHKVFGQPKKSCSQ